MLPRLLLPTLLLLSPVTAAAQAPEVRLDLAGDPLPPGAVARFGALRLWHPGGIEALAFSPDGKVLVSGVGDGTFVRAWDATTGRLLREVVPPPGPNGPKYTVPPPPLPQPFNREHLRVLVGRRILSHELRLVLPPRFAPVAFAPDGAAVLVGANPCCQWWDPVTGGTRPLWDARDQKAHAAAFAPDGKTLALALTQGEVVLLDPTTGKERGRLATPSEGLPADALAFAADGKTLAVGFGAGNVWLWDCVKGKRLRWYLTGRNLDPHRDRVAAVAVAPGGKAVAVAWESKVKLFETATDAEADGFTPVEVENDRVVQVRFADDGKTLVGVAAAARVLTWDAATGKKLTDVTPAGAPAGRVAVLSPSGRMVARAAANSITLFDAATGKPATAARNHPPLLSAAFTDRNGLTAACADTQGVLHFFDAATGKEQRTLAFPKLADTGRTPLLSPDGRRVATWTDDLKGFRVVDALTGKDLWTAVSDRGPLERMAFSADGGSLALTLGEESYTLEVWDAATGKRRFGLTLPEEPVNLQPVFAPDGRSLAAASLNHRGMFVWELATQTLRQQVQVAQPLALAFARDARHVAVVSMHDCPQLFRVGAEEPPLRLGPRGDLRSVALSPDGRWLAAGDSTGGVQVTEVKGSRRHSWNAHEGGVTALAFSADGTKLLSAGMDGTAVVWSVAALPRGGPAPAPAALTAEACWQALGEPNGVQAAQALAALTARGDEAVVFLKSKLAPLPAADPKQLAAWLKDLDSPQFGTRDRATRALEGLGDRAEGALRAALKRPLSAEAKKRVQSLLGRLDEPLTNPERLRQVRAVEALEQVGSPAAAALLEALAQGAPGARLTREARASLDRLRMP